MLDDIQTILVIDDHPLMRKGIIQLIAMEDSLRLAGEAGDGRQGLELARQLRPDLILLDLNMRGLSGLDTLKALKATDLDARVIILTVSDSEEDVVAALRAGADGYLLKDMEPEELMAALDEAVHGHTVIAKELTGVLARAVQRESLEEMTPDSGFGELTPREREILCLLAEGQSNKVIARNLGITDGTVKLHVKAILRKLSVHSRVEAAVLAVERQLCGKRLS